jgi:hypothetical protein
MKLFYDANDLMNMRAGDDEDWDYFEPLSTENQPRSLAENPDLANEKMDESQSGSYLDDRTESYVDEQLYHSIKDKGIHTPVTIGFLPTNEPILVNGHHRTVVANHINPNMYVPHEYTTRQSPPNSEWTKSYDDELKKKTK